MKDTKVTDTILYIGADDHDLDLFESQYVIPNGISYNSYVILDEKVTVMDTIDARKTEEWLVNLEAALEGRKVDYLVVQHMEPDHAASIQVLMDKYPEMTVVGNAKTFAMIPQFFDVDLTGRMHVVKEGDTLNTGKHTFTFVMAPMVPWSIAGAVPLATIAAPTVSLLFACYLYLVPIWNLIVNVGKKRSK